MRERQSKAASAAGGGAAGKVGAGRSNTRQEAARELRLEMRDVPAVCEFHSSITTEEDLSVVWEKGCNQS